MIQKIVGIGIGRAIFTSVFVAGEAFLAPKYFRNLIQLFLNWEGIMQGTYLLPSTAPRLNVLFLAWAFVQLAVMIAISNVGVKQHRGQD